MRGEDVVDIEIRVGDHLKVFAWSLVWRWMRGGASGNPREIVIAWYYLSILCLASVIRQAVVMHCNQLSFINKNWVYLAKLRNIVELEIVFVILHLKFEACTYQLHNYINILSHCSDLPAMYCFHILVLEIQQVCSNSTHPCSEIYKSAHFNTFFNLSSLPLLPTWPNFKAPNFKLQASSFKPQTTSSESMIPSKITIRPSITWPMLLLDSDLWVEYQREYPQRLYVLMRGHLQPQ